MLNICWEVLKSYNSDVKLFKIMMAHNSELLTVSWFSSPLIKKCYHVHHSDEMGTSHLGYYVILSLHWVDIPLYNDIKSADVNNWIILLHILTVFLNDLSNDKDRKVILSNFTHSLQLSLFMKFVKFLIYYNSVF